MRLLDCSRTWPEIDRQFEWIRAMRDCPQDPVHHAEGDVWTHVRMVLEALAAQDAWRTMPQSEREILHAAALLHDVAKPVCTKVEDGRITSRGHSSRGAIQARRILWELDADLEAREQVCSLVRHHQIPFFLIEKPDALRIAIGISQAARCDWLALLATADALGRRCTDQPGLLTRIALFEELCRENGCLDAPWNFPSPLSRFEYFRKPHRDASYRPHDDSRTSVILMSGLPGAGKDHWIRHHAAHLPQISLDAIRRETGVLPSDDQGAVLQEAKRRARALLRDGTGFVWNATNLARDSRAQLVDLFTAYYARVRIVYVESSCERLFRQNRERQHEVPQHALERMLSRWEVPGLTEAPSVEWWESTDTWVQRR